ncbi:hypothetical protein ACFLQ7_02450, partial [Actinomycetota bacterium]
MCCLFASLVLIGPRFAILVWWIIDQVRWEAAFSSFFVALIGWLAVPWTTMMYVVVFPGGVTGFDWIIMGIGKDEERSYHHFEKDIETVG